jgi:16S rRNA (cytidine1402-2'-O)-methyltransferase
MIARSETSVDATGSAAPTGFSIDGQFVRARPLEPGLYVVATPIGNLGDITLRALGTLAAADLVACEDTRVTGVLMSRYGIGTRLTAYHDHNAERQRPKLMAMLGEGKRIALVSDAGTPLVSDPGYRLVLEAVAAGINVVPVPGASAVMAALVASALPTDAFLFAGFLPAKGGARRKRLSGLSAVEATLVFFEAPPRIAACLADMASTLGADRQAVVARELTKAFETVRRGTLGELATQYAAEPAPKGEIVVLVGPPGEAAPDPEDADRLLAELLKTQSVKEAASEAATMTGLPRRDLYRRALAIRDGSDGEED